MICEAGQYGRNDFVQVPCQFLGFSSAQHSMPYSLLSYWTEGNGCGSQPNQPAVSSMRLMNGISILVAELLYDLLDAVEFFGSS